ncbi:uncharacterized protein LOC108915286 [Anoplophora glabripennis]|uniref:uncharacterized protein LOC108915286 n=1 Tax=Anoplophora glabripennis TaxID=217634 RepID=UPI0008754319|nr:uncharacterized protein LOC108915286 [Anoplophora glabripennis]
MQLAAVKATTQEVSSYINANSLCISNRGCEPTFVNSRSQTLIDVTITTACISNLIRKWHVADQVPVSDHRLINFDINLSKTPTKLFRDPRGTDKERYLCHLRENLIAAQKQEPKNDEEIEVFANTVQSVTKTAFDALRSEQQPGGTTSWWNRELSDLKRSARRSFNKAKAARRNSDWEIYKTYLRLLKKLIRKRQSDAWRTYCEE